MLHAVLVACVLNLGDWNIYQGALSNFSKSFNYMG